MNTEEAITLARVGRILRRQVRTLAAAAVAAALIAAAIASARGATYSATTRILLPVAERDGQAGFDVETEAEVVTSAQVVQVAMDALGIEGRIEDVQDDLSASVVAEGLLRLRAEAGSPEGAVALAQAVTDAYITVIANTIGPRFAAELSVLETRRDSLLERVRETDAEVVALTSELAGLDPSGPDAAQVSARLDVARDARFRFLGELDAVEAQIADAQVADEVVRQGIRVIDAPQLPSEPDTLPVWVVALGAAALGAAVAAIVVVARDQSDERLRRRADIARALGAPVLASIDNPAHLVPILVDADGLPVDAVRYQRVVATLGVSRPAVISIIVLDGDWAALSTAARFATCLGRSAPTVLTTLPGAEADLAEVLGAVAEPGLEPPVRLATVEGGRARIVPPNGGYAVAVTAIAAEAMVVPFWDGAAATLALVSASHASASELVALAEAAIDARTPLDGVVVVDPDPDDRTTGRLLDENPNRATHLRRGPTPVP